MRVLLPLSLALFSTFSFARDLSSTGTAPRQLASADIPARISLTGVHDPGLTSRQQEPTSTNLIDAPSVAAQSTTAQSTCTWNNHKPCSALLNKIIGAYPPIRVREEWNGEPDSFFAVGDGRRTLHPDKGSWAWFAVTHAAMWASAVAAARNYPASNQPANSAYPAAAAITGFDFLLFKTISPAMSVAPPVCAIIVYSLAASK
jgi:hypothetical protein